MNLKRILCPVDFSEYNHAANEYASMLAKSTGAQLIYLHTYLPNTLFGSAALFEAEKEERRFLKRLEESYKPTFKEVACSYAVEFGTTAEQILRYAKKFEIDLIVIGTHGRTGLSRVVMGSVAEAVARQAECPVLAIKSTSKVLEEATA